MSHFQTRVKNFFAIRENFLPRRPCGHGHFVGANGFMRLFCHTVKHFPAKNFAFLPAAGATFPRMPEGHARIPASPLPLSCCLWPEDNAAASGTCRVCWRQTQKTRKDLPFFTVPILPREYGETREPVPGTMLRASSPGNWQSRLWCNRARGRGREPEKQDSPAAA